MKNITKKDNIINLVIIAIYAVFTLILVLHHEIWADEAQVWMIAKSLSVPELFRHLVNEGHPSFFYLLIMPFAKSGCSVFSMQIICWISSCLGVYLLLRFAPFNRFTKLAVISSAGFLYFFPVIARSYSLLPVLVFLTAILYKKQKEHPILYAVVLAALANIHIIMFGFVLILGSFFVYDNLFKNKSYLQNEDPINYKIAAFIIFSSLFAVWLQLHGTTADNIFIKIETDNFFNNFLSVICKFFAAANNAAYSEVFESYIVLPVFDFCLMTSSMFLYITLFVFLFKTNKKMFFTASFSILFQILIYTLAYRSCVYVTRIFSAHIILLFALWIMLKSPDITTRARRIVNTLTAVFFLLTLYNGVNNSYMDFVKDYSGAKQTALFIEKNIDKDNSLIITDNGPYCMSLIYYLDGKQKIYSLIDKQFIKYIVWDEKRNRFLDDEGWGGITNYMKSNNPLFKTKKIYAVLTSFHTERIHIKKPKGYKLIYQSKPCVLKYENYAVYEYIGKGNNGK